MSDFPIRCFTCGKVIAKCDRNGDLLYVAKIRDAIEKYTEKYNEKPSEKIIAEIRKSTLDELGMKRYCCRRMYLGYVNTFDQLLLFSEYADNSSRKKYE